MKLLIDCKNGICADMLLGALMQILDDRGKVFVNRQSELLHLEHEHEHEHEHHHRSYQDICRMIKESELAEGVKTRVLEIYEVIARAEAKVHGESLETVHFHEVGRAKAIEHIVGIAAAVDAMGSDVEIFCSEIHDGHGFIQCSHGTIPVPVPAVQAMKQQCDYEFVEDDVDTEMVTPSGLGILIGLGAECRPQVSGACIKTGFAVGTRDIGRPGGLKVSMIK